MWNYVGEKRPMNSAWNARLPRSIQESFTCVNLRHGTDGFTSPPKEGVLRIFSPWKIRRLRLGLNPRTWVAKASTLPLDHRSRKLSASESAIKTWGKGKSTVDTRTGHEGPEGAYRCRSTLSLTSALDGVGGQRHDPATEPPGKTRYPFYRRLSGSQGRSGRVRKISPHRDSIPGISTP